MITGDRSLASGKRGAFYNTLEELRKHFDHIDIICPRPRVRHSSFNLQPFPNVLLHPSPWPLVFQWFWISRKGVQIFYDRYPKPYSLITVHEYSPVFNSVGARMLQWRTGVPYILEVMHIPGVPRASGLWERVNRWLTRIFIASESRKARAVRVINEHQTPDFLVSAGVPRKKLKYLPAFYIDQDTFRPVGSEKKYDLVFVGRLSRNKGLDIFLEVVRLTGLSAVIVGDGPLLKWASSKVQSENLPVVFAGFAKDSTEVARYLDESRMLLMPSLNEGGPRVVLEAMACGVPVVATPVGIVPDVFPPECIGNWSAEVLAGKVTTILGDSRIYAKLREQGLMTSRRFERTAAVAAYADSLKRLTDEPLSPKGRILIIAQTVNENDDHRSFLIGWLKEFAKKYDEVSVIALSVGQFQLPDNVHIYSLGKERGASKISQALRFYRLLLKLLPGTRGVFAHASPIFIIAAWPIAFLWHKKLVLWYLHRNTTVKLRTALVLSQNLVTADIASLTIQSPKIIQVGHAIDIEKFAVTDRMPPVARPLRIVSIGRLTPIKGFETLISAAARLRQLNVNCEVRIVGKAVMPGDHEYHKQLTELITRLGVGDIVHFFPSVPYRDIHAHFQWADVVVGCTPRGGIDKVLLEGMAAGCVAFTSNSVMRAHLGEDAEHLIYPYGDSEALASAIAATKEFTELPGRMIRYAGRHNLPITIGKIAELL